ncbi:MAG: Ig-like domain-containing protein [Chloroflexota bacterium]
MSPKRAVFLLLFVFLLITAVSCREEEATPTPTLPTATAVAAQPTDTPPPASPTPPGLGIVTLDDSTPLAPSIIGQNPAIGEETAPDGSFEIYFDQPMDETATANALQVLDADGQPIAGEISWPQPRILQFKPNARLKSGSSYQAVLAETAVSADGQSLLEGLTLTFYTIGDLSVSQVSPAADVNEVAIDSAVTVIFNRPVIPLQVNQEGLQNPDAVLTFPDDMLTFDPPITGSGEWINTSVYIFRPDQALMGSTSYTAQVNAAIVNEISATGALMASDYAWQFTTTAPTYRYLNLPDLTSRPSNDYKYLPLDQPIEVVFTQPMDPESAETAVTFTTDDGITPPYTFSWDDTYTTLTLTPSDLLQLGTWYNFTLSNSAQSATGGTLRSGITWRTKTYLEPQIYFTEPEDGTTQTSFYSSFRIQFTSPMSLNSIKDKVIFNPPIEDDGTYSQWDWSYRFYGLRPSTSYTVQILPGMTDIYGNAITEGQTIQFTTAAYAPLAYFNFPGRLGVYRQNGSTAAWITYRNVNRLDVSLYQLNTEQFNSLLHGGLVDVNYVPPDTQLVWGQSVPVSAALNDTGYKRFDMLSENGEPLEPGLYFITFDSPQVKHDAIHLQAQPLVVATANLTLKTTATEALVWLTDLESGAPVADVPITLYDRNLDPIVDGTTNEDGLIYWDNLNLSTNYDSRYYAITDADGVYGVAISGWNDGINPYDFGISTDYYLRPNEPTAYVYTDRPIYRPDQVVSFKGIVRTNDDLNYSLPTNNEVHVTIRSYQGTVYQKTLSLSEFGSFTGQLELDSEATLGSYFINVTVGTQDIGGGYFDVAEYRKPTFQVNVTTDKEDVVAGDTIDVTIDATFFSGGAVVNGNVDWVVRSNDFTFSPGGNFARYSFNSLERDTGYYYDYYYYGGYDSYYGDLIASGTGQTDSRGQLTITIPADLSNNSSSQNFTIEATVTDVASNQVSGRSTVTVHRSLVYPGIRADRYVGSAGDEMNFDLAALDWYGTPIANQEISVSIVERRWYSVQEENENGDVIWRSSVEEIPITDLTVTTDGNGRTSVPFTPPNGGVFRAYARLRDSDGNDATASTYFWASGGNYVSWRRGNDHSFDLIADADSYKPGDTAEILIASPFQGETTALVTVERGHIKQYETIQLTTNSTIYRLPITGDMAPNVFISVMVMKGVDETNPAPDFKVGMAQFTVEREEQELTIDITPDREIVGPGDTVEYTIRVYDYTGSPVEAEVSLALADLAALSIAAPNSQNILDFFYSQRWLSVNTALLLTRNMDAFNQELEDQIKGGGGGGGDYGVMAIRENFPDTAYWEGQVNTGPDGEATISVTLPDNLTTLAHGCACRHAGYAGGQATKDIQSTKPVLVSPVTPVLCGGRSGASGTAVHNNTDQPLEANVTLQAEGVILHSPDTQSVTIPPKQQAVVYWNVLVEDVTRVDFVFSVNAGEYSDASRPTLGTLEGQGIPVYKYEVPETVGTSGQLTAGGAVVESIALPILPGYTPSQGNLTIELAPSLVAAMTDGLDYLEHYTYECTEQVVSKFLPNVLTTSALKAAGMSDPDLEQNLQEQVNIALQKLYSRQRSDGGWPWWDGRESNTLVTAYVVQALLEARDAGYDVRAQVLNSGIRYLQTNLPTVDSLNGRYKFNRQAYLVYVLARAGEPNAAEMDQLYSNREGLDLFARGYLAQAIYLMDSGDPRLETLAADFITTAIFSASGVHWEEASRDYWNWGSDTRTTAIILDTMIKLQPDSPLVANAVRWLMDNRVNGRWATTQETAWTLISLIDWIVVSDELQPDYQYEVAFNGTLLTTADVTAATVRDTVTLQQDITTLLTTDLNRLAMGRTDGPGNLYYTAHMNIYLPVEELRPLDKGIILSRSYYDPNDRTTPITEAELGDTFLARLTIVVPNTLHYALIEDFLPAGLEAVDTSLLTSQQEGAPERYEADEFWTRGYGWWYFDHVELRDEKVVISANYLPAGTYEYVYLVRASTLGEFRTIPPTGQEFYFPEVYGRGAGMIFTVHPQGTLPPTEPPTTSEEAAPDEPAADEPSSDEAATDTAAFDTTIIGTSANGSDIVATRIGTGETAVLFIGGMHAGFAPSTVDIAEQAIAYFAQSSDALPANVSLYVIANINPDSVGGDVESVNGRFNGNGVDLNRNWGCNWSAEAVWRDQAISGGTAAFSEPETVALRDFILKIEPAAVVVFEAKGQIAVPGVCDGVSVSEELAQVYADAAGYEAGIISLSTVTGDITDWLDSQGIPAIASLLADYETPDWEVNLAGMEAVLTAVAANE